MSPDREFFQLTLHDAISALDLLGSDQPRQPDFSRAAELAQLAATILPPDGRPLTAEKAESVACQLAAIARRGYPGAMRQAADLIERHAPSGPGFKQYWREYLELLRADATRHLLAATNGKQVRESVGQAAAEYVYVCCQRQWLIDEDFDFLSSFLVAGDQFQYEGYVTQLARYALPDEVAKRALAV